MKEYLKSLESGGTGVNINELFAGEITETIKHEMLRRF